jgi:hypothetical protein
VSSRKSTPRTSSGAGTNTFTAEPRAAGVDFTDDALIVRLEDGRRLSVPLDWLPRLKSASAKDRSRYELIDGGEEIRWPTLDEDSRSPASSACPTDGLT